MVQKNIVALVDIGSAETKVLLVRLASQAEIIGVHTAPTEGLSKGEITDIRRLMERVHAAVSEAEKACELSGTVHRACLSLSGMSLVGMQVKGTTCCESENEVIGKKDIETARGNAYSKRVPNGKVIVHRIKQSFTLDGKFMDNPEGRVGRELAYNMWVVAADKTYLTELIQIPNQYGMRVEEVFAASLASAAAVETRSATTDKNRLVIDIGAGTTDYILYQDGMVRMTGVIPVGGRHLTNDISCALCISEADAETAKLKHARAIVEDADVEATFGLSEEPVDSMLYDLSNRLSAFKLNFVTHLRVKEIFELVREKIGKDTPVGFVRLTGGTAHLPEIERVAAEIFGAETSVSFPEHAFAKKLCADPKFSTVVGMAELLLRRRNAALRARAEQSFWARLKKTLFNL